MVKQCLESIASNRIALTLLGFISGYSLSFYMPDISYQLRMMWISRWTKPAALISGDQTLRTVDSAHETTVYPTDIDGNFHMNNARYIRELNFARRRYFFAAGIWKVAKENKLNFLVRAQSIRHRKELKLWDSYKIYHSIIGWSDNEKCFYVEARFVRDSFVVAVQLCKYVVVPIGGKDVQRKVSSPSQVLHACGLLAQSGSPLTELVPDLVRAWEEANRLSSLQLRPRS